MDRLYDQALVVLEEAVERLSKLIPSPKLVPMFGFQAYRYTEKTPQQAIVQKLARVVTGLHAAWILLKCGFFQEQGALHRMLDEIQEDVCFLSYGLIFDKQTELHSQYLAAFYQEEFDAVTAVASTQRRKTPYRKEIHAYLAEMESQFGDPKLIAETGRTLSKGYSGYVHAASPHIMELYGGNPPRFRLRGMRGSEFQTDHEEDIWNYFYRGILACSFGAMAIKANEIQADLMKFKRHFEEASGRVC